MRRTAMVAACLLLSAAAHAQSNEYGGVELAPRASDGGEMVIEVNSWTKLPVSVERIEIDVGLAGGKPCRFVHERAIDVAPTATVRVTIASSDAMRACRESQRPAIARAKRLRFAPVEARADVATAATATATADVVAIKADVKVDANRLVSRSHWRVEAED